MGSPHRTRHNCCVTALTLRARDTVSHFLPGDCLLRQKPSRSPPSGCSAPALPQCTGGNLLSSTAVVYAPAGGPSEGPGVPSQLETLLPGHRKGHPSRLDHAVGSSTVKLLMPLASNGGRDHHVAVRTSSWTHWSLSLLVGRAGPVVGLRGPYGSLCTCSGRVAPLSVASPSRRGGRTLLSPAVSSLSGRRPLPPARSWRP